MKLLLDKLTKSFKDSLAAAGLVALTTSPVVFNQNPVPASRPRVSKWGAYYGKRYTEWRKHAEKDLEEVKKTTDRPLIVVVEHMIVKPKTSKRLYPQGDIDNCLKPSLDAITSHSKHWEDDDQIIACFTYKRFAEEGELPKTIVHIYEN